MSIKHENVIFEYAITIMNSDTNEYFIPCINSRERNRMHAKMTRDRKKLFISSIEKTIADLEEHNKRMRGILAKQALRHSGCVTPDLSPVDSDLDEIPPISAEVESPLKKQQTALDNSE